MASTTTIDRNLTVTAKKLGVSLASLLKANPQLRNPNLIRAGTQLRVPSRRKVSARESARQLARVFAQPSSGSAPAAATAATGAFSPSPDRLTAPSAAQVVPDFQFDPTLAPTAATPGGREIRHRAAVGEEPTTTTLEQTLAARRRGVVDRPLGVSALPTSPAFDVAPTAQTPRPVSAAIGTFTQSVRDFVRSFSAGGVTTPSAVIPSDLERPQDVGTESLEQIFGAQNERRPNTLRSLADDDPIVMTELIRNADGTVTRKPITRSQMEERLSTPQDVVLSQSINGRTYNMTASDIAYGARLTGQALFEFRKQEDPSLRPSLVSNVSAYNLLGMGETLTGTPVSSVEDMMTKLGYTLVGDFWVVNDPFSSPRVFESPSLSRERRRGGGGGRVGRGPSGFGRSPSNLYNWHIRITV